MGLECGHTTAGSMTRRHGAIASPVPLRPRVVCVLLPVKLRRQQLISRILPGCHILIGACRRVQTASFEKRVSTELLSTATPRAPYTPNLVNFEISTRLRIFMGDVIGQAPPDRAKPLGRADSRCASGASGCRLVVIEARSTPSGCCASFIMLLIASLHEYLDGPPAVPYHCKATQALPLKPPRTE